MILFLSIHDIVIGRFVYQQQQRHEKLFEIGARKKTENIDSVCWKMENECYSGHGQWAWALDNGKLPPHELFNDFDIVQIVDGQRRQSICCSVIAQIPIKIRNDLVRSDGKKVVDVDAQSRNRQ